MQDKKPRLRRFRRWTVGLIAFAVLAYVILQPYLVSRKFRQAYGSGEFAVAERFVDFPTLRENLLQRLADQHKEPASKDQAASMANLGHAFMQKMVESTVRPAGFAALAGADQPLPGELPQEHRQDLQAWNMYAGLNVFTTELYAQEGSETVSIVKLYFRRRNTSWELYDAMLFGEI